MTQQLVFYSYQAASDYCDEARRRGWTVSQPFLNHMRKWQVTRLYV
jgi:hypothetical protein